MACAFRRSADAHRYDKDRAENRLWRRRWDPCKAAKDADPERHENPSNSFIFVLPTDQLND
jgi:hypothetical protein